MLQGLQSRILRQAEGWVEGHFGLRLFLTGNHACRPARSAIGTVCAGGKKGKRCRHAVTGKPLAALGVFVGQKVHISGRTQRKDTDTCRLSQREDFFVRVDETQPVSRTFLDQGHGLFVF